MVLEVQVEPTSTTLRYNMGARFFIFIILILIVIVVLITFTNRIVEHFVNKHENKKQAELLIHTFIQTEDDKNEHENKN